MTIVHIIESECDGCGLCVDFCPLKVLKLAGGIPVVVKPDACYDCQTCEDLCPQEAIQLTEA